MKTKIELPAEITKRKAETAKIAILCALAIICIGVIIYSTIIEAKTVTSIGYIMIIAILAATFTSKSYLTYAPTNSRITVKILEFSATDFDLVQSLVDTLQIDQRRITNKELGANMHLEIAYSKDKTFAAYQFFKYIPYEYVAVSEIKYLTREEASRLSF